MTETIKAACKELGDKIVQALKAEVQFQGLDVDKFEFIVTFPPGGDDLQWWADIVVEVLAKNNGLTVIDWSETMPLHRDIVGPIVLGPQTHPYIVTYFNVRFSKYIKGIFTQAGRLMELYKQEAEKD